MGTTRGLASLPGHWRWEQRGQQWWRIHDQLNIEDGPHGPGHLLGRYVTVSHGEATIATGRLLAFGQDGEFEIEDSCGVVHYCWPLLTVTEYV